MSKGKQFRKKFISNTAILWVLCSLFLMLGTDHLGMNVFAWPTISIILLFVGGLICTTVEMKRESNGPA